MVCEEATLVALTAKESQNSIQEKPSAWQPATTHVKFDPPYSILVIMPEIVEEESMASLQDRIVRAAKLDVNLYEEVEADKGAMGQATVVVVLSSIAGGIGSVAGVGLGGILVGTITAIVAWYVWAFLTYLIGTKLLPEPQTRADVGELLRTIGFSSSPGLIRVLGIIPFLRGLVFLIAGVWMLVAMVIAVRQALDYQSTLRALGVSLIGWVVQGLIIVLLFYIMGGGSRPV